MEKIEPIKETKKIFMIAQVIDQGLATLIVWPMVRPYIEDIIKSVQNEYDTMTVWANIVGKLNTDLFIAYELPWDKEEKPTDIEMYNAISKQLVSSNKEEGFIGYIIQQFDLSKSRFNLWQVYVKPEYRATTAEKQGIEWVKRQAIDAGAKELLCSTYIPEQIRVIEKFGFKRGRQDFVMDLSQTKKE